MKKIIKLINHFWPTKFSENCPEPKIVNYFAREGHMQVQGWLSPYSLSVLKILANYQEANGIGGNVAEIGVFHGRFFIALCLLMRREEVAVAIDVFGDQELNLDNSGVGDYSKFCTNIRKFIGSEKNIRIIHQDSLLVKRTDLLGSFNNGLNVRLFSVDGCHTPEHTLSDLLLAEEVICDGGVIILDDYQNTEWPGVEIGLNQFLEKSQRIVPVSLAYNKLYLTTATYFDRYKAFLLEATNGNPADFDSVEIGGRDVPVLQPPVPEAHFKNSFIRFIDFSQDASSKLLRQGWFNGESWGVWSDGSQRAAIVIDNDFTGHCRRTLTMVIALHAFVADSNSSVPVEISINNVVVDTVLYSHGTDYINWKYSLTHEQLKEPDLTIAFGVSGAKSPQEAGLSADDRVLGVGLRNISFY